LLTNRESGRIKLSTEEGEGKIEGNSTIVFITETNKVGRGDRGV